jgi:RNA polymerase sigma-70 factor (ECF subfamily)
MAAGNSYKTLSDKELADLYRSSAQQELVAELYGRYSGLLFGVCMKYLEDADAAADACADIYIELVQKMLKHEVQHPKSWLHTLTRNHCLMKIRSDKKMPVDAISENFVQLEDNWHPEIAKEKEKRLSAMELCIEELKDEQRQAVRLFYMEEKSYNEIAEITGISWNSIRSQIQNGRRNLKLCIEEHERASK